MTRDAITRQREAIENARAALQPFVVAWRALDSGLTDADRELFAMWTRIDRANTPDLRNRVEARRFIERRMASPMRELGFAKIQIEDDVQCMLQTEYHDSGVTFAEELAR